MTETRPIRRIAVVGSGVIGPSWSALFLAKGLKVVADVDDRPRDLLIRTQSDTGDHVRLSVTDAGIGFRPEGANKLFDAFYTTKKDGMGIGLSVSRSIIDAHHGRLWATPNDGPGATFSFSVPCSRSASVP